MIDASPSDTPQVSVLMAVHNGQDYLEEAMRSMMAQTLEAIEIIVIDDASTDDSPAILARLAAEDPRIRVETLVQNLRLPRALNRGLEMVRAPLVARMDADDIAHARRLEVQKRYMDAHPRVALLGTSLRYIDEHGTVTKDAVRPRDAVCCRWLLRFMTPIMHPTFMFRADAPDGFDRRYDADFVVAQDHDFTTRIARHGDIVSLGEILLDYRQHGGSTTTKNWQVQNRQSFNLTLMHCEADLTPEVLSALAPFRAAYYLQEDCPPADIFAGLRAMLAQDRRDHPGHAPWMRRQAAQLAYTTFQRLRLSKRDIALAFLRSGRDFVMPLALRGMEVKRWLPAALRSDPEV